MFYTAVPEGFLKVDDVRLERREAGHRRSREQENRLARSIAAALTSVSWIVIAVVTAVMTASAILYGVYAPEDIASTRHGA